MHFTIPRLETAGLVNNQREKYNFKFDGILGPEAKQDEVFERTARKIVKSTLEGRNGTIFAYGQVILSVYLSRDRQFFSPFAPSFLKALQQR